MIKATNPIIRFFSKKKEPYFFLLHKILGFKPKNIEIYKQAFVHRSALGNGDKTLKSNERLEYLGDAMLSAVMADILYTKFPDADEGFLTQKRAILVQRNTLDMIAQKLKLSDLIVTQKKFQIGKNSHVPGNALEALIGAIYEDKGYEGCKMFVIRLIKQGYFNPVIKQGPDNSAATLMVNDVNGMQPKVDLLQWAQKHRLDLRFEVAPPAPAGSKTNARFHCTVFIENVKGGEGYGTSKKTAQASAAVRTIEMIETGMFNDVEPSDANKRGPRPSRKQRALQNRNKVSETPEFDNMN